LTIFGFVVAKYGELMFVLDLPLPFEVDKVLNCLPVDARAFPLILFALAGPGLLVVLPDLGLGGEWGR
jgi:hypothetical protein